jgi:hypothetical protein
MMDCLLKRSDMPTGHVGAYNQTALFGKSFAQSLSHRHSNRIITPSLATCNLQAIS